MATELKSFWANKLYYIGAIRSLNTIKYGNFVEIS